MTIQHEQLVRILNMVRNKDNLFDLLDNGVVRCLIENDLIDVKHTRGVEGIELSESAIKFLAILN